MTNFFFRASGTLGLIFLAESSGCVKTTTSGDATIYTLALWVPIVVILGAVGLTIAGWFVRRASVKWGWIMLVFGAVALVVSPSLFTDRVSVSSEGFSLSTGLWFDSNDHEISFSEVSEIHIVSKTTTGRRGRKSTHYNLVFHLKSGGVQGVPMGDLMRAGPVEQILEEAHAQQIPIVDQT